MIKCMLMLIVIFSLHVPASGLEIQAPEVPLYGAEVMPQDTGSFEKGLQQLLESVFSLIRPQLKDAAGITLGLICMVIVLSMLTVCAPQIKRSGEIASVLAVSGLLLRKTGSMIRLAEETVRQIRDYGNLLLPVMTTAMAAQGGATSSVALYAGTAFFSGFTGNLLTELFVPGVYFYLALAIAAAAVGEDILKKIRNTIHSTVTWSLKTVLTVFITYMSITGVISGTTDAAALKAAKVTISTFVPVVGSILSEASETVLVSAAVMKNSAGIYGILAVLSIILRPFVRIGLEYLILKASALICGILGEKGTSELIGDFSTAMGLLLGITGAMSLLLLISTVCFMKGVT